MTTRWVTAHGRRFEIETLNPSSPAPIRKRRAQHRFTKIPGIWEEVLGKAHVSGSTYAVAIVLLYEAWKLKSNGQQPIVKLTGSMLKRLGIGRDGKAAALLKLSELRLVGVEQVSGRNRSSLCTSSTRRLGETWGRGDNTARAADAIEYSQAGAESRH